MDYINGDNRKWRVVGSAHCESFIPQDVRDKYCLKSLDETQYIVPEDIAMECAIKALSEMTACGAEKDENEILSLQRSADWNPSVANTIEVTGFTSPISNGTQGTITITAKNGHSGNTDTSYRGTVSVTSSDGSATLPSDYTFTGDELGVHTLNVTLNTAGTHSITVTDTADGSITGSQINITVT